jgi:hypothetical protein
MMARRKRIMMVAGERNARLEAISFVECERSGQAHWLFRCDCGQAVIARVGAVRSGNTVSCGCQKIESATRHGMSRSPEYRAWRAMIDRCANPENKSFHNYGARGIKVCKRWQRFEKFIADMGVRPSSAHSIDRFPDNDGDYEPLNCRWATWIQQAKNRRKPLKRAH